MGYICCSCGLPIKNSEAFIYNGKIFCGACTNSFHHCTMCTRKDKCAFQQSIDPLPKKIVKTIQQGNMTLQTEIINPARVEKFCVGCVCYDEDLGCRKQFNTCIKYDEINF